MLSVEDWDSKPPHKHIGSYRFEHDRSWTPLEKLEDKERDFENIRKIISLGETDNSLPALEFFDK